MNCKPGDLATVTADSSMCLERTAGMLVEVLHRLPGGLCRLPDGTSSHSEVDSWCIKFQRPLHFKKDSGAFNFTRFASCRDKYLRPIRPDGLTEEEVRELYLPKVPQEA